MEILVDKTFGFQWRGEMPEFCASLLRKIVEWTGLVCILTLIGSPAVRAQSFDWSKLPAGEWVRIPTTGVIAPKVFHGGATIAPERNEVYFFGSDTHDRPVLEKGESNAFYRLNLETLTWSQDYEQDPKQMFKIMSDGQTRTALGRPWAMHTYDMVEWDPTVRRVVVLSYPEHARFRLQTRFPFLPGGWYGHLQPSHWEYDPATMLWIQLQTNAPRLFGHGLTWDSDRKQLVAHDGNRTYHFDRDRRLWVSYTAGTNTSTDLSMGTIASIHLSMVYDTYAQRALLLGGDNKGVGSNVLFTYHPEQHQWKPVRTQDPTFPANGAAIAYDTHNKKMLYLANLYFDQYDNPTGKSVTFLYDSRAQSWTLLNVNSPELYGMNYLMQYDPVRRMFLHFEKTSDSGGRIVVWAFRL